MGSSPISCTKTKVMIRFFKWLISLFKKKVKVVYPHFDNYSGWEQFEQDTLVHINMERVKTKRRALIADESLQLSAEARAIMLRNTGKINHDGFQATSDKLHKLGLISVGENIASGYTLSKTLVSAWMHSPTHKSVLLGNYRYCGVGYVKKANNKTYIVMMVGK